MEVEEDSAFFLLRNIEKLDKDKETGTNCRSKHTMHE